MSEIEKSSVFKKDIEVTSILDFAKTYGGGVSSQAIEYAIKHNKVDYVVISNRKFVVLTSKTKTYTPNAHPDRPIRETLSLA